MGLILFTAFRVRQKKYGFIFYQIGEPIQYHGTRVPYLGIILDIEQRLLKEKPEFVKMFLMGLERKYYPKLTAL